MALGLVFVAGARQARRRSAGLGLLGLMLVGLALVAAVAAMAAFHRSAPRSRLLVGAVLAGDFALRPLRASAPFPRLLDGIAAALGPSRFGASAARLGRRLDVVGHS